MAVMKGISQGNSITSSLKGLLITGSDLGAGCESIILVAVLVRFTNMKDLVFFLLTHTNINI